MGFRIRRLAPEDPPDAFPDPSTAGVALGYPDGLLAVGGDLSDDVVNVQAAEPLPRRRRPTR